MQNDKGEEYIDIKEGIYGYTQYCSNCKKYIGESVLYVPFGKKDNFLSKTEVIFSKELLDELVKYHTGCGTSIRNVEEAYTKILDKKENPLCISCKEKQN